MARIGTRDARKRLQDTIDRLLQEVRDLREQARTFQRAGNWDEADRLNKEARETNEYLTRFCRTGKH